MELDIEQRFANTARSKTFRNIVRTFELGNKAVLDLGCSYGEFLAHFGPRSVGVTIDTEEAVYGQAKGLDIVEGNVEAADFRVDKQFDVIFSNNLFEHLYSPHGFLHRIREYLKPGGILILGVPCIPKIASLVHFQKFRGALAEAHINFFTKDTLRKTVERAGYDVAEVRGFRFSSPFVDHLLDLVYPHLYVVAHLKPDFNYPEKRMKELAGYGKEAV